MLMAVVLCKEMQFLPKWWRVYEQDPALINLLDTVILTNEPKMTFIELTVLMVNSC